MPKVFQEFCGPRVLTLSYLPGTKLDEWGGRSGPSPAQKKRIIEEGVKCTARQFFEVGFFTRTPTPAIYWWILRIAGLPRLRQDGPA